MINKLIIIFIILLSFQHVNSVKYRVNENGVVCLLADFDISVTVKPSDIKLPKSDHSVKYKGDTFVNLTHDRTDIGQTECSYNSYGQLLNKASSWIYIGQNGNLQVRFTITQDNEIYLGLFYEELKDDQYMFRGTNEYHRLYVEYIKIGQITNGYSYYCSKYKTKYVYDKFYDLETKYVVGLFIVDINYIHIDSVDLNSTDNLNLLEFNPSKYCLYDWFLQTNVLMVLGCILLVIVLLISTCCYVFCRKNKTSLQQKLANSKYLADSSERIDLKFDDQIFGDDAIKNKDNDKNFKIIDISQSVEI